MKTIDVAEMTYVDGGVAPFLVVGAYVILTGMAFAYGAGVGCTVFCD